MIKNGFDFIKNIKYLKYLFKKKSDIHDYVKRLPSNEIAVKEILNLIDNNKTKVILTNDVKHNYYVFLNDTIYLSDNKKNSNRFERICILAHECIHSIQNKVLQVLNFIFSNLELLFFLITLIFIILFRNNLNINLIIYYSVFAVFSVLIRIILEVHAIVSAPFLVERYLNKLYSNKNNNILIEAYKTQTFYLLPVYIISLFSGKFIRIIICFCLYYILMFF